MSLLVRPVTRLVPDALRELLLLERAEQAAEGRSSEQQSRIRVLADAADARLSAIRSLKAGDQIPPALVLLRDAAILVIRAIFEARGIEGGEHTADDAFRELASLIETGQLGPKPPRFERARELLSDTRNLAFDELSASDAVARRSEAEATVAWLRSLVDTRSLRQIKASRVVRLGTMALVVVGGLTWGVVNWLATKNIALGKPVQMSSRRPDCPTGSGEEGLPPSGVVDGSKSGSYDICSKYEVRPWLTIDLQAVRRLSTVIVYNRGDCCWGANDLPIALELSEDGTNFAEVARRTTVYSVKDPWVVPLEGKRAKVIRLHLESNDLRELVLTEVEVFSR